MKSNISLSFQKEDNHHNILNETSIPSLFSLSCVARRRYCLNELSLDKSNQIVSFSDDNDDNDGIIIPNNFRKIMFTSTEDEEDVLEVGDVEKKNRVTMIQYVTV